MIINLKHSQTGITKQVKLGFSWTTLFFGCFPALFRGDVKWAAVMFLVAFLTFGLGWFVFPFIYNKIFIREQLEKGYVPADNGARKELSRMQLYQEAA